MVAWSLLATLACNNYDLYRRAGYEQATFSNTADVLFVIDDSPSMTDEAESLALNIDTFIALLASEDGAEAKTDTLSEAVDNYLTYVYDRGRFLDYQLGVTTTSVQESDLPGDAGKLVGLYKILQKGEPDLAEKFIENIVCEGTCWKYCADGEVDDCVDYGSYDPDDLKAITVEYLDDTCGVSAWRSSTECGAGTEEGLEGALLAMCRAVESPPDFCYDAIAPFSESNEGTNEGFIRDDSTVIIVIVSDEGDYSRRMAIGDTAAAGYTDLFDQFNVRYRIVVIGPHYDKDAGDASCNEGAELWSVERYQNVAAASGGFYNYITEPDGDDCVDSDFSQHLTDLGELLANLQSVFPLQSIPDVGTISVLVDGIEMTPSEITATAEDGTVTYGTGWYYDSGQNAVVFTEDAIPDYNEDVRIYYQPLEGQPRSLPF